MGDYEKYMGWRFPPLPITKFWNCYVEGTNGGVYYKHGTRAEAYKEAERLARIPFNKGKKVYLMESIAVCEVPEVPVVWDTF